MSVIERHIQVGYRHQVHFARQVFDLGNPLLSSVLVDGEPGRPKRVLCV